MEKLKMSVEKSGEQITTLRCSECGADVYYRWWKHHWKRHIKSKNRLLEL